MLLVLLIVGVVFAGDAVARPIAQEAVAQKMASALGVAPSDLKVSFAATPLPIQLLDGKVDTVDVSAPNLTLGPITGDATVHVEQVPLDTSKPVGDMRITLTVDQQRIGNLATKFDSGGILQTLDLQAPNVVANGQIRVLGAPVPIGISMTPGAVDGKLAFAPAAVRIGDQTITVEQLHQFPPLRQFADELGSQQTVCIADHLPAAVKVTSVKVVGQDLVATATGSGAVLSQLGTKGTC